MKILREITQNLSTVYPAGEASALARWALEEGFGLSLTDVILGKDSELSADEQQELQNIVQRLLQKEPVQYVFGRTTFCGLPLRVRPGVLIPRPETQELVEWICRENGARSVEAEGGQCATAQKNVLDIGTGSGCIALALAKAGFRVEAWDVSPDALAVAQENAEALRLQVTFRQQDILAQPFQYQLEQGNPIPGNSALENSAFCILQSAFTNPASPHSWDVIVSNPPYICEHEAAEMDENVLAHEPHLALFVPDDDPLLFYRAIANLALRALVPGGRLYFEINRQFGRETCAMLREAGFADVVMQQDQFGNNRMVRAVKPAT